MKRILILCNLFFITLVCFLACEKETRHDDVIAAETSDEARIGNCPPCKSYEKFKITGIQANTARNLATNYQMYCQPLLQIEPGVPDASNVWMSLENVKAFLWKIEKAMCNSGCTDKQLGIRIYYGRYPDAAAMALDADLNTLPADFEKHHTIFMVPTIQDTEDPETHWDFDPWHLGSADCNKINTLDDWYKVSPRPFGDEKSLFLSVDGNQYFPNGTGWASALNHGGLIPPYPQTGCNFIFP